MSVAPPFSAFSAVGICNRAFAAIEHRRFGDFGDGSEEAEDAAMHWDAARRHVLAAAPWNFATRWAVVSTKIAETGPARAPTVVQLPAETLYVRNIDDAPAGAIVLPFGDKKVATDQEPPFTVHLTEDVTEPTRFSPGFVECLALYLAHLFAPKYTRSQNRAEILHQRYLDRLGEVLPLDASEGGPTDHRPAGATRGDWSALSQGAP